MNELDDRLVGDPVWELFTLPDAGPAEVAPQSGRHRQWLLAAALIILGWAIFRPLGVVMACLLMGVRDFRAGRNLARSIPVKAGGAICSRFRYAWAAWKVGTAACATMFLSVWVHAALGRAPVVPPEFIASVLIFAGAFLLSAGMTAAGLLAAYRSEMRVWLGEGVNRARMLVMAMLIVGFTMAAILPWCVWLSFSFGPPGQARPSLAMAIAFFACLFGGPLLIVNVLDRISRRVIAEKPGKFGPKVPTVGKWNA